MQDIEQFFPGTIFDIKSGNGSSGCTRQLVSEVNETIRTRNQMNLDRQEKFFHSLRLSGKSRVGHSTHDESGYA